MSRGPRFFGRGGGGPGYNFVEWNHGYNPGPPQFNCAYHPFYRTKFGPGASFRGRGGGSDRGRPFFRYGERGRGIRPPPPQQQLHPVPVAQPQQPEQQPQKSEPPSQQSEPQPSVEPIQQASMVIAVKDEALQVKSETSNATEQAEGEERLLNDILRGRHPIVFCNEQSKCRNLAMDWEQISETGPPHNKTFSWSLKMGNDLVTTGVANSKKAAKSKAAEDMARKLDKLPRPPRGEYWGGGLVRKRPQFDTQFHAVQHSLAKRKRQEEKSRSSEQSTLDKKSQDNPISKLYEHCRQMHWPDPLFETIGEEILETVKTQKGFTLKRIKFTMQCTLQVKKFIGVAMTKKEAKYNAAAGAWAEFGVGIGQESITDLLQSQRDQAS